MLFPVGAAHPADGRDGPANGSLDRDALLKKAREKPDMERLNLAEAKFHPVVEVDKDQNVNFRAY